MVSASATAFFSARFKYSYSHNRRDATLGLLQMIYPENHTIARLSNEDLRLDGHRTRYLTIKLILEEINQYITSYEASFLFMTECMMIGKVVSWEFLMYDLWEQMKKTSQVCIQANLLNVHLGERMATVQTNLKVSNDVHNFYRIPCFSFSPSFIVIAQSVSSVHFSLPTALQAVLR